MTDLAETSKPAKFVPGQPDMWAFVLFETLAFTAYFGFYLFYRARSPELLPHAKTSWIS
jgi:nitric oxide reductase NorE protein